MKTTHTDIIIIGAGLTGLTLAYYLRNTNFRFKIIEARDSIGGRIYTKYKKEAAPIELGATWFANQHTEILSLLKELNLKLFEQTLGETAIYEPISTSPAQVVALPKNQEPSYRLKGGTSKLTQTLASFLNTNDILLNEAVTAIKKENDIIEVSTLLNTHKANYVISTLPPHLFENTIAVHPKLENDFSNTAQQTHTWMGESIKIGLTYEQPFWKEGNLSGTIFSNVGPIPEMYDHSNYENNKYALIGFLNGNYYKIAQAERLEIILNQLEKYYGKQVRNYICYEEMIWKKEAYTSTEYQDLVLPHQNNGDTVFQKRYLNNQLFIAGTETSPLFSGYMEGAVRSAQFIFNQLQNKMSSKQI